MSGVVKVIVVAVGPTIGTANSFASISIPNEYPQPMVIPPSSKCAGSGRPPAKRWSAVRGSSTGGEAGVAPDGSLMSSNA